MTQNTASHSALIALSNDEIADVLEELATLLGVQSDNFYRVHAYQQASEIVRHHNQSIAELYRNIGKSGLEQLPHVGKSIAASIEELLHAGQLRLLNRLRGEVSPEDLFTTIPGIGDTLAHRIHELLGIETLEALELAAHDGRLDTVEGFGTERLRLVPNELATLLSRSSRQRNRMLPQAAQPGDHHPSAPTVALLLEIDAEYRTRAQAGQLRKIAPLRFNPEGKHWLPILHLEKETWWFTALYSNTARAHQLGKIWDWVVIFYEQEGHEGQSTVVTEFHGPLRGQRVVRGREVECLRLYQRANPVTRVNPSLIQAPN